MNPDLQKELFSRLDAFAAKLGVASAHVWGVLTKQAYIEGVTDFIWVGVCLILVGVLAFFTKKLYLQHLKEKDGGRGYDGAWLAGTICMLGPIIIVIVIAVNFLNSAIQHVINPEFYALQLLIDSVK